MRPLPWTGALLALLLVGLPAERQVPTASAVRPVAPSGEIALAVEWIGAPGPATDPRVWRDVYRVSNRGGTTSGPLEVRVRSPLGLVARQELTASLAPGETVAGIVEVQVVPGLSELCLDVRALGGERTLPESDISDNRICRRLSDRADSARLLPATHLSEDAP